MPRSSLRTIKLCIFLLLCLASIQNATGLEKSKLPGGIPGQIVDRLSLPEKSHDQPTELPIETPRERPELPLPAPPARSEHQLSSTLKIHVKKINLSGHSVFSHEQLAPIIAPYQGRDINTADLFALRNALTQHYIQAGYINSGALIPDQNVEDGVIDILIVEGTLTQVIVHNDNWLDESYVRNRLTLGNEHVLNIHQLRERIKILQQDRLVERINAELSPGANPGESRLTVQVEESRLFDVGISFNNHRSPSIGELHGEMSASAYNVSGYGDALTTRFSLTEGLDRLFADYSIPLTAYDTRLRLYYEQNDAHIIEQPFDLLSIQSINRHYGLSLSQPVYFSPRHSLYNVITLEHRKSTVTFQLPGSPRQPFPSVTDDGITETTALRFLQEWSHRSANHVLAFRSTLNWGVDVTPLLVSGSRINDEHYFSWQAQFQWLQRLGSSNIQFLFRADTQLTPDSLLPMEKFSIGGAQNVRGYRENQLIRDYGVMSSVELRVPVFKLPLPWLSDSPADGSVQLAAFYDFGWGENNLKLSADVAHHVSSAGFGLRWSPAAKIHSEIYYAFPLRNIDNVDNTSLQDQGISFSLSVDVY